MVRSEPRVYKRAERLSNVKKNLRFKSKLNLELIERKMEAELMCEDAVVVVPNEPEGAHLERDFGNNHSTRRAGTHLESPPASPAMSTQSNPHDAFMGTPASDSEEEDEPAEEQGTTQHQYRGEAPEGSSTPNRPPSPEGQPPRDGTPVDVHLFDHVSGHTRRPTGYGTSAGGSRGEWPSARVAPAVQAEPPPVARYTGDAATTHVPATDPRRFVRLGILSEQDLPQLGTRPEDVNLSLPEVGTYEQAYPYARRYAREVPSSEIKSIFTCLGLAQRGYVRVDLNGHEELGLHPTILSALMNADWRLESQLQLALLTPIFPSVVPQLDINTSIHNLTDGRFHVAPMFMPVAPAVAFASRLKWLPIQRGMLQIMEELARTAVHNQSGILHSLEEVQAFCGLSARAPDLMLALETMLVQQTATLVELVHQVIYAHRHAYVKDSPDWFRHGVLRQPVFNQRQLFRIPDEAYSSTGAGH